MSRQNDTFINRICSLQGVKAPNYDADAGIHYGVIHSNNLLPEAVEDIYQNGTDLDYESAKSYMKDNCANAALELASDEALEHRRTALAKAHDDESDPILEAVKDRICEILQAHLEGMDSEDLEDTIDEVLESMDAAMDTKKLGEVIWESIEDSWSENLSMSCDGSRYRYEDGNGLILETCSDGDIFVIKSPLFTMADQCSPCAPNAGYITSEGGMASYALGCDWFEKPEEIPYKTWSVTTGEPVIPNAQYRLVNLVKPGETRCTPPIEIPEFEAFHDTKEAAEEYAKGLGFASWAIWTEYRDSVVSQTEFDDFWAARERKES